MDIDDAVYAMREWIARSDWTALESRYDVNAREADPRSASDIRSIDLRAYATEIERGLDAAAFRLRPDTAAVYWEFDPDNAWSSAFFFCKSYRPEAAADDEWAADYESSLTQTGPSMPALADHMAATWNGNPTDAAVNAFLIARTIASFGRASRVWDPATPLCAGYHDQEVVLRVGRPASDIAAR